MDCHEPIFYLKKKKILLLNKYLCFSNKKKISYALSLRSSYIGGFIPFIAQNNVKFNHFTIADGSYSLLGVVLNDCRLVNKHILLGVISVDETIATLYVEPLDSARDFFGC